MSSSTGFHMQRLRRFLLLVIAVAAGNSAQAQGILTFETESFDFGSITEGEKPTYTFRFTNTGDSPLTISHVQPSCGCTAPSYSTEAVHPNDAGEITVEFNSEGRPGDFNKTISVQVQGAVDSHSTLRITGTVIAVDIQNGIVQGGVAFDADTFTFSELVADSSLSHTFRMQNTGEQPLQISEARVFNNAVVVTYPERLIFPREIVDVVVTVQRADAVLNGRGEMDVAIVLFTDDAHQPSKSLRLRGRLTVEDRASASE